VSSGKEPELIQISFRYWVYGTHHFRLKQWIRVGNAEDDWGWNYGATTFSPFLFFIFFHEVQ